MLLLGDHITLLNGSQPYRKTRDKLQMAGNLVDGVTWNQAESRLRPTLI